MTQQTFTDQRQRFTGRAMDMSRAVLKIVSEDVRTWDVFKWIVVVLLALNLLVLLSLGGLRSEIAGLKEERGASAQDLAALSAALGKELADTRAGLTQAIADMRSGLHDDIVKINAKLDARAAPPPKPAAQPAQKPAAKPRP